VNGEPPLSVPNKLLAVVPAEVDPAKLARDVRTEVLKHWREDIASPVKEKCLGLLAPQTDAVWAEQIDTLVEFQATWTPLGDYAEARHTVERAIAGRKNLRDFDPWQHSRGAVPKSSLDGARESVLREQGRDKALAKKYRIVKGEQLDAVSLVKRAGGEPDQFVPVVNIALASWVQLAASAAASELGALRSACGKLGVSRVARKDLPCASSFPFDASVLLPSRWRSVFEEQGLDGDPEAWGRKDVHPLLARMSEPYPYVACLVADGDRMGRALDSLPKPDDHRAVSKALSRFAANARTAVEQRHNGCLIYSGGDDVLAFLPSPEALACAEELSETFAEEVGAACSSLPENLRPTLSAGVAIGHIMDGMGDLLALGREAEREAKRERNSLAVLVDKRSGGRLAWSARWNLDPAGCMRQSIQHLEESLPSRKIYEIATILRRLPGESDDAQWATVLAREVERTLSRSGDGAVTPAQVNLDLNTTDYKELRRRVRAWVDRLLIARVLARSVPYECKRTKEAPE
jgi:CRISPR-associated protein Cmr2